MTCYIKKLKKSVVMVLIAVTFMLFLSSCKKNIVAEASDESEYVVEAANAFAVEKETEIETIAPTEEHRPLEENYRMNPAREIYIGENQFMTRINYIYNHVEDFADSNIVVEGMYGMYYSWDETFSSPMIYRNGPADYGDDQYSGFYLDMDNVLALEKEKEENNVNMAYRVDDIKLNDWIRVKGKPYMYEHTDSDGEKEYFMFLKIESYELLSTRERKAEMVND